MFSVTVTIYLLVTADKRGYTVSKLMFRNLKLKCMHQPRAIFTMYEKYSKALPPRGSYKI